ncbi:MAG: adenosylcobalamin-dependent ribonucleoside-diphosphate reductase [Synergistaceae bacterium]|nr:adenosylcobalamin-dependent ribonucleoside-diphosphate reductase [Synergistaceae bacterium]
MSRSYEERFNTSFAPNFFEIPAIPRLSSNAMWLLEQRYFVPRYDKSIKQIRKEASFEEFARRVGRVVTSAETIYLEEGKNESIKWLKTLEKNITADILDRRFLFNSPCLFSAAAGLTIKPEFANIIYKPVDDMTFADYRTLYQNKTKNQQLFACFVLSIPDSIEGIFESVKDASIISKFGGGVGGNFGHLREHGSEISGGTGGKASGPVSFMETWNTMGAVVVQGGKRRAALMGMLFDNHPDIFRFIDSKTEDGKLSYFNISVAISDALMEAAKNDGDFSLLSRPGGKALNIIKARDLMDKICENAWKRGDPGIFFIDRAQQDNILKMSDDWIIESTNPCGEQPLPNYTSCNLGSINVEAFAQGDKYDWQKYEDQVYRSIYYLDLVIDACSYPLKKIGERTRLIRPVGLGIMGLADAAIMQKFSYGDKEFNLFCERLGEVMATSALCATVEIVDTFKKEPFSEYGLVKELFTKFKSEVETSSGLFNDGVLFSDEWFKRLSSEEYDRLIEKMRMSDTIPYTLVNTLAAFQKNYSAFTFASVKKMLKSLVYGEIRNSRRLSIAPTGSISMLLDSSSGIEPNFAWTWTRHIAKIDGTGTEQLEFWHKLFPKELREEFKTNNKISDSVFKTAYDITTAQHVGVTGIFARLVDSGISKTVNLPNSATKEDVKKTYESCYQLRCKGITIYRDGSRSYQPIEIKKAEEQPLVRAAGRVKERPGLIVFGKTIKDSTPWGSLYVTLNFDGNEPFEIFISIGKSGSELKAMTEALSRVISIGLRSGCKLEDIVDTLKGLSGKEYWMLGMDEERVARSLPDAIAVMMDKLLERGEVIRTTVHDKGVVCPECKSPMEMISGCAYCFNCGYSPCK